MTQLSQMAAMSEKAAAKTVAVVGDDLAISCNQLIGGQPERKVPMVMRVVKGSLRNKAIMIPCALALSMTVPGLILPALTVGGALLCFDSVDKIINKKLQPVKQASEAEENDHAAWENRHVKRALRTDLLLSAEITTVSLATVVGAPFLVQLAAMAAAGLAMTAGVYGVVAGLIKFDDIGAALTRTPGKNILSKTLRGIGKGVVHSAPPLIKAIGLLGTAAMFMVGGGMLVHGIPGAETLMRSALASVSSNAFVQGAVVLLADAALGIVAGFAAIPVAKVVLPPWRKLRDVVKNAVAKVRHQLPAPAEDIDAEPAPAPAPQAAPSPLQSVPDIKADLNMAAQRPANDSQPAAPEAKAQPAAKKPGI
jgi:uncharacterized protein